MTVKDLIEKLKQYNENAEINVITIGEVDDLVLIQSIKD